MNDSLKDKVKNQIGKEQPSGFKLLTHYYPKDASEQVDDIFKIIESEIASLEQQAKEPVEDSELFRKVYIKSESDLPKKEDEYYCYSKGMRFDLWGYDCTREDIETWLDLIDWYLQPVQQIKEQQPKRSAEETNFINDIRQAVADYMYSEGCSCCRDIDAHEKHTKKLGELLKVNRYSDDSGYDFSQYRSK